MPSYLPLPIIFFPDDDDGDNDDQVSIILFSRMAEGKKPNTIFFESSLCMRCLDTRVGVDSCGINVSFKGADYLLLSGRVAYDLSIGVPVTLLL